MYVYICNDVKCDSDKALCERKIKPLLKERNKIKKKHTQTQHFHIVSTFDKIDTSSSRFDNGSWLNTPTITSIGVDHGHGTVFVIKIYCAYKVTSNTVSK